METLSGNVSNCMLVPRADIALALAMNGWYSEAYCEGIDSYENPRPFWESTVLCPDCRDSFSSIQPATLELEHAA